MEGMLKELMEQRENNSQMNMKLIMVNSNLTKLKKQYENKEKENLKLNKNYEHKLNELEDLEKK